MSALWISIVIFFGCVAFAKPPVRPTIALKGTGQVGATAYFESEVDIDEEFDFDLQIYSSDLVNSYSFSTPVFVGSPDYIILDDGCSGVTLSPTNRMCKVEIRFKPQKKGLIPGSYSINFSGALSGTLAVDFEGRGKLVIPEDDPNPPPKSNQSCLDGSIIRADSQSLGEHIDIVGTEFFLSYSSEYAESYVSQYFLPKSTYFNPHGWTISAQHFYDFSQRRLFRGHGEAEYLSYAASGATYRVVSSDGAEVYYFDKYGRHLETRWGLTGAVKYSFSYAGNILSAITDGHGNVTTFAKVGSTVTISGPHGQESNLLINSNGLYSSFSNPNAEVYQFAYKAGTDLLETFTKPGGQVSTFTYSSIGKLSKDEHSGGNFWQLLEGLYPTERKVAMTSQMGRSREYKNKKVSGTTSRVTVDPSGLEHSFSESDMTETFSSPYETISTVKTGNNRFNNKSFIPFSIGRQVGLSFKTTYHQQTLNPTNPTSFDDFVSITSTETTAGRTTSHVYTSADKTKITTTPMGATSTVVINNFEQPVELKIGSDTPTIISYDLSGRVSSRAQGTSNSVAYTYGTNGFVSSETNARSETTSYVYDLAGRVTQVTRPDSKVISYAYDANGNLVGVTPPGKLQHVFEFNALELLGKYDPPALAGVSVKETLYTYNLDKQLTSIVRPDLQSVQYTYNATKGLLDKITVARGDFTYSYPANRDQVSQIDSPDGIRTLYNYYGTEFRGEEQRRASDGFVLAAISNGYDATHRKTSRTIRGNYPAWAVVNSTLNDDDMPVQIGPMGLAYSYPSGRLSTTTLDKISDSRTYDSLGNLESYTATYNPSGSPAQTLYSYTLVRDAMSRIVGKTETIQGVTSTYVYTFDNIGRLTGVSKNGIATSSFSYDDNGNRTSGSVAGIPFVATYDAQDRLVSYGARTYSYNANGDNTQIQWTPTLQSTFAYDAFGRLLGTTLPTGATTAYSYDGRGQVVRILSNGSTLTRYIYDPEGRIAGEFTDAGVMWRQFVYGTQANTPDFLIDGTGNVRFITDHLGTPRLLVKVSDGTILQRMDFNEFGLETANTNPTYQPFGFAGGLYLRLPGLVKFGARYYDPMVGRWTSKDPILFNGGDTNLYGYVASDPVNWVDSSGLEGERYSSEQNALIQMLKDIRNSGGISLRDAKAAAELGQQCGFKNQIRVDLSPVKGSMGPHLNVPIKGGHIPINDIVNGRGGGGGRPSDLR